MLYETHKKNLTEQLSRLTDQELLMLESKATRDGEAECANACSAILLQRRNRPVLAKDEYRRIDVTEEDFDD